MPREQVTYRHHYFSSIKEACRYYNISYTLVRKNRKDYNITITESMDIELNKIKDHHGVSFRSFREMCDFHGIPYRRFQKRLQNGHSIEKCLFKGRLSDLRVK